VENQVKSIAFPNISTGVYGFPKQRAAEIAVKEVMLFFDKDTYIEKVIFSVFDEQNHQYYKRLINNF
jgi:O-acetyl-ADP-ribose deacetylase